MTSAAASPANTHAAGCCRSVTIADELVDAIVDEVDEFVDETDALVDELVNKEGALRDGG